MAVVACSMFGQSSEGVSAADVASNLKTIKSVGAEAKGNAAASRAWAELAKADAKSLPDILVALDDASPLAANWIRSAVETIADRELNAKRPLPIVDLEKYLAETSHDPRGRRLAFELLTRVDPKTADRLLPGMLNDPSVEIRRDAVARLLKQANELFDADKTDDAKPVYQQALTAARDDDQVQAAVKRLSELGQAVDLPRHFGFIQDWSLIGPFDNTGKAGFNVVFPPENNDDLTAEFKGKDQKVRWTKTFTTDNYGIVDLAKVQAPHKGAITYARAEFMSDKARDVDFRLGTPNSWKLWVNSELAFSREEYHRGMALDQYRVRGRLKAGKNVILLKVCQNEQTEEWAQRWQFQLRVCDATGTAILSTTRPVAEKKDVTSR
jgi:hypothetical protein